jgi:diacylglycerol kinase family enzyme
MMTHSAIRMRSEPDRSSGYAVLLNANAKQVTADVRHALAQVVAPRDLFLSRSAADAHAIADTVVSRRYETVFTGGGDGTFVGWVNHILDRAERTADPVPRFGVLALGTGNAIAEVVGARPRGHMADIVAFANAAATRVRRLDLLTCDGRRTPFAGVGMDAAVLNDYCWLKGRLADTALRPFATGIPGYALSIALRSAPRHILERRPSYCEIVNVGRPAYRLDGRGRQVGAAIGPGELLYAGPCVLAAASTVPFYGFGLKAFPFADARPGMLQLRVASELSVSTMLWNLPRIWAGEFEHPGLLDFHAERVSVHFERPMPLQVGGDAEGWREHITFGMAERPVELVDFKPGAENERRGFVMEPKLLN